MEKAKLIFDIEEFENSFNEKIKPDTEYYTNISELLDSICLSKTNI